MKKLTRVVSVLLSTLMLMSAFTALNFSASAADKKLTVRANSNLFETVTQDFEPGTNQLTVTWWMEVPDTDMINTQCVITYDRSKLEVDMTEGVNFSTVDGKRVDRILRVTDGEGTVTNYTPDQTYLEKHENHADSGFLEGEENNDASIKVNAVNLSGSTLTGENGKVPFASVTFNPIGGASGVTDVNLYVEIMQIVGENEKEEHYFVKHSEIADSSVSYKPETPAAVYAGTFEEPVAAGDIFTIAGSENFLSTGWTISPTTNVMTLGSDGIYKITVPSVKAVSGAVYEVKVVQFYSGNPEWVEWHGVPGTGANVDFGLSKDCDVTVTYNPNTGEINVTGDGVGEASSDVSFVTVAGNGKDVPSFVNGKDWDPAAEANKMTATGSVYEITYKGVAANKDLEFKFVANGAWALSWGNDAAVTSGTAMDAHYNGKNIKFKYTSAKSTFDLTLKLDLTNWDANTLAGAKFTVIAKDSEEPTTAAPTTAAPTTAAPTTAAPTTAAPTTAAPTTKPAGDVYTLAGTSNFIDTAWEPTPDDYVMTKGADGSYKITVPSVKAVDGAIYQVKVVQFVDGDPENMIWHGKDGGDGNVDFGLSKDCDVTVTYNPNTKAITVTGAGVTEPSYKFDYVTAVGVGNGNFLNGVSWDPTEESNKLTEVSSGVYEITYNEVKANTDLKFKFTANGAWVLNWGYNDAVTFGTPTDAHFDGADIVVNYKSQNTYFDITLRLDLSKYDADKRTGATFTVTAKEIEQPTTEKPEPTTAAPTTAAPTTAAPTTAAPTTAAPTTAAPTTKPGPTDDVYTLAGTSNFIDTAWEPTPDDYVMTKGSDGIYKITVPSVTAIEGEIYQVKVVQFVGGDPENMIWHGKDGGDGNVDFGLSKDCDVTVTYNPNTKAITVTGAGVTEPSYKFDYVTAVGVGNGNFLNGVSWDPTEESNKLTEVSSGVYEITYNEVKANTDLKFKFTANGAWVLNWGYNDAVTFGTPTDAHFDGADIVVNYKSQNTYFDITLRLDLSKYDADKRTGATFTVTAKEIEQPTTEKPEPTTAAPTTAAPTTAAPTTAAPTTAAPTTAAPTTKPGPTDDVYTLAGTSNFIDTAWEPTPDDYVMTKGSDGIYKITVPSVTAIEGEIYQVKVVQFVGGDPENPIWHGKDGGDGNVDFGLSKDCDVTVTYDPNTKAITVTGAGVTEPSYALEYVTAAGSGYGNFLNGVNWDPTEESNRLTMVSPNVYEITYEEVDANTDLQFKFAANGGWVQNWGYTGAVAFDTPTEAHFDGGNIVVNYESINDYFDLTIRLDLTKWDAEKRTGATFTVIAKEIEQPTTEPPEPTTVAPTTAAPTTVAPTTAAPTTAAPTTAAPTTAVPTTAAPTTVAPTTAAPTTVAPTTAAPTTEPIMYGDVNQDGKITVDDVTTLQKYLAEMITLNDAQKRAADTDGDGQIKIVDATEIQKYLAEIIHHLGPKS